MPADVRKSCAFPLFRPRFMRLCREFSQKSSAANMAAQPRGKKANRTEKCSFSAHQAAETHSFNCYGIHFLMTIIAINALSLRDSYS